MQYMLLSQFIINEINWIFCECNLVLRCSFRYLLSSQATAAATFETACNYRIHQFDPSDSDEELWEDKEPSFTNLPNDRHR